MKKTSMGVLGNSIIGMLGVGGGEAAAAAGDGGLGIGGILGGVASGGVGGGALMAIIGMIKSAMAGKQE